MYLKIFLIATVLCSYLCEGYKILVVFPFPSRSHNNLGNGFVRHLLKAGHEVTYITPFPLQNPHQNLHQIDVSSNKEGLSERTVNIQALLNKEINLSDEVSLFFGLLPVLQKNFENENVRKLLRDPNQHFDAIIVEWMFTEIYSGLSAVFNCPYIWSYPYPLHANTMALLDGTVNPAYTPNLVSNNIPPFTFFQRVQELFNQIWTVSWKELYTKKYEKEIYDKIYTPYLAMRGRTLPEFGEMRLNASMMLGNSHESLTQTMSLPQNFKYIGGFHLDDEIKPLPQDLQQIMDNANHGVVYFSMGSNLKSKDLPEHMKKDLVKMFGKLNQTILWKFEEEILNPPENIHTLKWAPQQSILSHPNCVIFITHGGLLSMTEAVHFGVPVIGIPVFADQFRNVDRAVHLGFGRRVDITNAFVDDMREAIVDIVNNPRYQEKTDDISLVYHDRTVPPGRELVHWVEHVVRTRGAPHLRSPALHVPWYQKTYLDLAAVITAVLLLTNVIIRRLFSKTSKKTNVVKKKN